MPCCRVDKLGCLQTALQVSHDDKGCTSVSFLETVDVRCPGRVADLMARATRQRAVGATALNERSSRSHLAFMLTIAGANPTTGQNVQGEHCCGCTLASSSPCISSSSYCGSCVGC